MHHHRAGRAGRAGRVVDGGLKLFVEMLKPVAEHAEKEGVLLLVEPEPGLLDRDGRSVRGVHEAHRLAGRRPELRHRPCLLRARTTRRPTIQRLAKYIRHVHLEDIAATRVHHHLIPGEGAIDFAACSRRLQTIGYQGWVTIELYPYMDDPDAAARTARADIENSQ